MKNYIIGIGEVLWDMLPAGKQLGGAPANFAYHVKQLGLPAKVVSAIGRDSLGDEILSIFKEKEIPSEIALVDYPTGTVQVTLDKAGVPSYEINEHVAWDYIPFTDKIKELASQTQVVCFGSLAQRSEQSRSAIYQFLDAMPRTDHVLKVFDINLRQQFYTLDILQTSLSKCNILKINDEELAEVSKLFNLAEGTCEVKCRQLIKMYDLSLVILTCGERGSYVLNDSYCSFLATPHVAVADTVGAGDAFTAAFIAGLLKGNTIKEAHQLAVAISAFVCTKAGAMPNYSAADILNL